MFSANWEDDEVLSKYIEDIPMGAPCKGDFVDEFRSELREMRRKCLEDDGDPEDITVDKVKERIIEKGE